MNDNEARRIAAPIVKEGASTNETLATVIRATLHALADRDADPRYIHHTAADAVKAHVTIARCHSCGHGRRAFWWPKRERRLVDTRCPGCGDYLSQTTLALQASFERHNEEA